MSVILLSACVEPFTPEITDYENLLVVEGMISNEARPYTVKLSKSTNVNLPKKEPFTGVEVTILDDVGNSEILTEVKDGIYETSPDGIEGIAGRKYKIKLKTPEDKMYESEFQQLKETVGVDSLYVQTEFQYFPDTEYPHEGYRFFIDTHTDADEKTYFLWQMIESYEYNSDYRIYYYYDHALLNYPKPDSLFTCWQTRAVNGIFSYKTVSNSENIIQFPLNFVSAETRKLKIKYTLLLKQYSVSKEAYNFWSSLQEINSQNGELYTQQPYQIRGNVFNVDDPDETVLGFFAVAGADTRRIFVEAIQPKYVDARCTPDSEEVGWLLRFGSISIVYLTYSDAGVLGVVSDACVDCRLKGGTLEKPIFFE